MRRLERLPDTLDLDAFRAPSDGNDRAPRPQRRLPRHRPGEAFLKGPIPWDWLQAAMELPGRALHVALLLWKEAGCLYRRTVRFRLSGAVPFCGSVYSARRGVRALEAAGLVSISRLPGRSLEVTLLECSAAEPAPDG